jgi:hypothetical protein
VAGALEVLGAAPAGAPDWTNPVQRLTDNYDDLKGGVEAITSEAQMAWHWEEAGVADRAAIYHERATRKIAATSLAYDEALLHITREVELLATLPESPERARREQLAYLGLGWAWAMTTTHMAPQVGEA